MVEQAAERLWLTTWPYAFSILPLGMQGAPKSRSITLRWDFFSQINESNETEPRLDRDNALHFRTFRSMAQADAGRSGIEQNNWCDLSAVCHFSCGDGVEEALITLCWRRTGVLFGALHHLPAARTQIAGMRWFD